jgi:hypothetical protein
MTKNIQAQILIQASPEKIWKPLTNFKDYPEWNPFIKSITGSAQKGNIIRVVIQPTGSSPMAFSPTILCYKENKKLSWLGKVLFKGLFDGEHTFELIDHGNDTTTFVQSEKFSGFFVRFFNTDKTEKGFIAMNEKLKVISEQTDNM